MLSLFIFLIRLTKKEFLEAENIISWLLYRLTASILATAGFLLNAKQFFGDPINCIADFTQQSYSDNYCWIHSTYTVQSDVTGKYFLEPGIGPYVMDKSTVKNTKYYQWVWLFLMTQAAFCYLPRFFLKVCYNDNVANWTVKPKNESGEAQPPIPDICRIAKFLKKQKYHVRLFTFVYVCCELLDLVVVLVQMVVIDTFLGGAFGNYGWEALWNNAMPRIFPKITMCTINIIGEGGATETEEAICLLPLNVVNEKLYLFLWFWLIFLAGCLLLNVVWRVVSLLLRPIRERLLFNRCGLLCKEECNKISVRLTSCQWFRLYMLGNHLPLNSYKDLIRELAKDKTK